MYICNWYPCKNATVITNFESEPGLNLMIDHRLTLLNFVDYAQTKKLDRCLP